MKKEDQLKILKSRYYKIYFQILAVFVFWFAYFFTVRYFISNVRISGAIIFPVFIILVILVIKAMKQMKQIRKEAQKINNQ